MHWTFHGLKLALVSAAMGAAASASGQYAAGPTYDPRALEANIQESLKSRMELLERPAEQSGQWDIASRYARCAISLNEDRVRLLLDQGVEGKAPRRLEFEDFLRRNKGCVIASDNLDRDVLRAAMAEQIVTAMETALPPPGSSESVTAFIRSVKVPQMDKNNPFAAGQLLAECRVGFAPVAARALIATEPGSQAEAGALAAMKAVTPQCDNLDTAKTKLTPWFERAFASQALYHWIGFAGGKG